MGKKACVKKNKLALGREELKLVRHKFFGHLFSGIYILIFISS